MRTITPLALALAMLAVAALAPASLHAQQPTPTPTTGAAIAISQVDDSDYPTITAVVTARDANGEPASSLDAADFSAFDGASTLDVANIESARNADLRLHVVIAIDVSGSMKAAIGAARDAATQFVRQLGDNDQATVIKFSTTVENVIGPTSDKNALIEAIVGLQPEDETALYDAVSYSAETAQQSDAELQAIVLLTDGKNDLRAAPPTTTSQSQSIAIARDAGIPVFGIGFIDADIQYLKDLAEQTGGQYYPETTPENIADVYGQIAALIQNQYILTLHAGAEPDGQAATLRVVANIDDERPPAVATAAFTRGALPEPPGPNRAPLVLAAAVGVLALGAAGFGAVRWQRRAAVRRAQQRVVAPNPELAAAQGVPVRAGAASAPEPHDDGRGRIVPLDDAATPLDFDAVPVTIGSGADCDVCLPRADDVAPRHAQLWMKDGKIMLRHLAGPRRPTTIAGRPVDWVILEPNDEFAIGQHRFRAERA